uniref:G-patch domain-containing protein n=1 Tax=Leptocylindrus danicus TaxID=163516 RepID=A0A6U2LB80_9STRA|mmetsp:Transcript_10751/g.16145  ORF Transcript_10751/g.16145 Transcript_10751/m.16145 type:complete len:275 (+) Transcript_10751:943-1767(+)
MAASGGESTKKGKTTIAFGAITKLKTNASVVTDEAAIQQARAIVANAASASASASASATVPVISKKDADNLVKWTERQAEQSSNNATDAKLTTTTTQSIKQPVTKTGQPICLVCKRKFVSMEKLKQHEELSALHKSNLAKLQHENANMYKDRAKERRFLYGDAAGGAMNTSTSTVREDEQMAQLQVNGPNLNKARTVLETEVVRPEDSVGAGNIGHQMLQKLGWRKGDTLGRKNKQDGEMNVKLKQDWETIETLASTSTSTYGGGKNKYSRYHQ